ncbi:1110_t:CDS:2, partial [Acaulospora morrowiae]
MSLYCNTGKATRAKTGSLLSAFNGSIPFGQYGDYGECFDCGMKNTGKGGFGIVQKATWTEGQIDQIIGWNYLRSQWERHGRTRVVVKILDNSRNINVDFFKKMMPFLKVKSLISESLSFHLIRCSGITRDPETRKYAI